MKRMKAGVRPGGVIKIAGAYMAWVIGSGFATGQEALRFFAGYGKTGYAVAGVVLAGFMLFGYLLTRTGFEKKNEAGFDHFGYFCGRRLGRVCGWLITATLLLLIPVLVSGGGAALNEYFGVPKPLGSAFLAFAMLAVYLAGFEKMVGIISRVGPVIILFTLTVGAFNAFGRTDVIAGAEDVLKQYRAAPSWWLSGLSYLGLNFFPASFYFIGLGASAKSEKELKYGAVSGGIVIMLSVALMSAAILKNASAVAGLDIPVLYLAGNLSRAFCTVFSVMLVLGIFSSSSVMMWTVCSSLAEKTGRNVLTAAAVAVLGYAVSLFSFGTLIGTFYPLIGYLGLVYLACVIGRTLTAK